MNSEPTGKFSSPAPLPEGVSIFAAGIVHGRRQSSTRARVIGLPGAARWSDNVEMIDVGDLLAGCRRATASPHGGQRTALSPELTRFVGADEGGEAAPLGHWPGQRAHGTCAASSSASVDLFTSVGSKRPQIVDAA